MGSPQARGREIPAEIAGNFPTLFPELEELEEFEEFEDILQYQEFIYQSLSTNDASNRASGSGPYQSGDLMNVCLEEVYGFSDREDSEYNEAIALSLSEMGNSFENLSLHESSVPRAGNDGSSSSGTSAVDLHGASPIVDPDNMSYEQLQQLGDSIGVQSKGVSDAVISGLPSRKFKGNPGFFAKKNKYEECVICAMEFEKGEIVTTLTCKHEYHKDCINRWLGDHKNCPVCMNEIA